MTPPMNRTVSDTATAPTSSDDGAADMLGDAAPGVDVLLVVTRFAIVFLAGSCDGLRSVWRGFFQRRF